MTLEERIHLEIPMSRYMQVSVVSGNSQCVELRVPLAPNVNHEGTAFGGSVSSLALLSCWSLMNLILEELPDFKFDYVVVQDSTMDYVTPIETDFSSVATPVASVERFKTTLTKHGRARLSMAAEVFSSNQVCATLSARFVAQRSR